jgi:adenosylcobinamide-GDP ribazoletransferase
MSDAADHAGEPTGPPRWWLSFRLAASFLTLLPVGPRAIMPARVNMESFGFFPAVGFAIGAALALEDRALGHLFGNSVRSLLVIGSSAALTGALHIDALADTADALGAGRDRVRALEIMRDSRIGVFGALAVAWWLALEWSALASLHGTQRAIALYAAFGLSRWTMLVTTWHMDYLRPAGAGSFLSRDSQPLNLRRACLLTAAALIPVLTWRIWIELLLAATLALAARKLYRRWLGGVTGDTIGAAAAVVEAAVLVAATAHPIR